MSSNTKVKYAINIDDSILDKLSLILSQLDRDSKLSRAQDLSPLIDFLNRQSNISGLVQSFSYYSTINDHPNLSGVTTRITKLIQFSNKESSLYNYMNLLINDLISSYNIKVFFRCLNNIRPSITNPALRLMSSIIQFNNGYYVDMFLENFDLSLKVLSQLPIPSKLELTDASKCKSRTSIRFNFIAFWIDLLRYSNSLTRRDLLINNKKIMTNWFKYLSTHDSVETLELTLRFLDEKVLMEDTYKKMTKCSIFGDWMGKKLIELYHIQHIRDPLHEFLIKLTTNYANGIVFHDDKIWFANSLENSSGGVTVTVGERSFKIYNKLIYNLLTVFRPWSDDKQLELIILICKASPELIPPFNFYSFHSSGSHDPSLTSYYIGQSLLLTKLIQLSLPEQFISAVKASIRSNDKSSLVKKADNLPATNLIEAICPSQLNRSSLTKSLASDHQLIRHIATELIISIFQKLDQVLKLLSYNETSLYSAVKSELLEIVISIKLPVLSVIIGALNETYKKTPDRKLLILNYLKICEYYGTLLNQSASINIPSINLGNDEFGKEDFNGIDLVILDSYLQLNSDSQNQNKWWIVSQGKNSLFTTIIRLPYRLQKSSDLDSLTNKVVAVITNLLDSTLVFRTFKSSNTNILNSQAYALLYSLNQFSKKSHNDEEIDKICKVLDESIARCIKSPYKYIDISNETCNENGEPVSPFFVSILEQSKFVKGNEGILEWTGLFNKYLSLFGEPTEGMNSIVIKYWSEEGNQGLVNFESGYEASLAEFNRKYYTKEDDLSFFEAIINLPIEKLNRVIDTKLPISDNDLIAIFARCKYVINDKSLSLSNVEDLIIELVSKIGNYLIQRFGNGVVLEDNVSIGNLNLFGLKYWKDLYLSKEDLLSSHIEGDNVFDKKIFAASLLNDLFSNLFRLEEKDDHFKYFQDYSNLVVELLNSLTSKLPQELQKVLADSLWILDDTLVVEYSVQVATENFIIKNKLLDVIINKEIQLQGSKFDQLIQSMTGDNFTKFSAIAKNVSFESTDIEKLLSDSTAKSLNFQYYSILTEIVKKSSLFTESITETVKPHLQDIIANEYGLLFLSELTEFDSSVNDLVYQTSIKGINKVIDSHEGNNLPLKLYLKSISKNPTGNNLETVEKLMNSNVFKNDASLIFSNEFASLIVNSITTENESILKPWLYRGSLYITKMFAETEGDDKLPLSFLNFIQSLKPILFKFAIWKIVPKSMLNSQLEACLSKKWVQNNEVLEYINWLIMTGSKNNVLFDKHIQIFINNDLNSLNCEPNEFNLHNRFLSSLVLFTLFKFDIKKVSNIGNCTNLLKLYNGSLRTEDLIIKNILHGMEQSLNKSWIHYVTNWEFQDEDINYENEQSGKFISNSIGTSGLTVNLSKKFIKNSIDTFIGSAETFKLPELRNSVNSADYNWNKWIELMEHNKIVLNYKNLKNNYESTIYDYEFLMLLIINNDELFKYESNYVNVDVKKLVDSGLLQFIVVNLANQDKDIQRISKKILYGCLSTIEDQTLKIKAFKDSKDQDKESTANNTAPSLHLSAFKDRALFKVFIGNLLNTLESSVEEISPLVIIMLSHLIPILNNPGHFLFEKAYRYILSGPKFRTFEVPLFKSITQRFVVDPHLRPSSGSSTAGISDLDDDYYKQLSWFLNVLFESITSSLDLKTINKNGILEYILNISSSPFLNFKSQLEITKILIKITEIPNGSDLLIRSYGLLSFVESKKYKLSDLSKGKKLNKEKLIGDFKLLEFQKLALRAKVGADCNGADKRARDWCDDDLDRSIKRVLIG